MTPLLRRTASRALPVVPVLLIVPLATTALTDLIPGSPALRILGEQATPQDIAELNEQLGLERPLFERYFDWLGGAVRGDFGTSLGSSRSVVELITQRLPVTLELAVMATIIALVVAIPLGLYTAARPGPLDRVATTSSSILMSIPAFVMAVLLIYVVTIKANLLPSLGWTPLSEDPIENVRGALLPALTLALTEIPVMQRLLRTDVRATLQESYILTAKARGLSDRYILFRHALRPSLFSVITVAGVTFGRLLGGAIVVESIFALPGLGTLAVQSVHAKDLPTIQGLVFFTAAVYVAIHLAVDLAYGLLDPRVRVSAT